MNSIEVRKGETLTLITTASTIGPRISPIFIPDSMAVAAVQLWIHGMNDVGE